MSRDRILTVVTRIRQSVVASALFALLMAVATKYIFGLSNAQSLFLIALPVALLVCQNPVLNLVYRACLVSSAGIFWGILTAVAAKYVFGLSGDQSFLFVFLPLAAVMAVFLWVKLPWTYIPAQAREALSNRKPSSEE